MRPSEQIEPASTRKRHGYFKRYFLPYLPIIANREAITNPP